MCWGVFIQKKSIECSSKLKVEQIFFDKKNYVLKLASNNQDTNSIIEIPPFYLIESKTSNSKLKNLQMSIFVGYFWQDLKSKTGTFLNDVKIEPTEEGLDIKHGDVLRVGDSFSLLLHIHLGSNTCIGCEPGEVMSKLKLQNDQQKGEIQSKSKEEARKETNRLIKKK